MTSERIASSVTEASRVADHVRVAGLEPEEAGWIETSVHAGDDRDPPGRRHRQVALGEGIGVDLVRGQQCVALKALLLLRSSL
jgi:hypothetical protein